MPPQIDTIEQAESQPPASDAKPVVAYDLTDPRGLELTPEGHAYRVLEEHGHRLLFAESGLQHLIPFLAEEASGVWHQQAHARTDGLVGVGPDLLTLSQQTAVDYAKRIRQANAAETLIFTEEVRRAVQAKTEPTEAQKAKEREALGKAVGKALDLRTTKLQRALLLQLGACYRELVLMGRDPFGAIGCKLDELDAQMRYIGAPNGVIDLETGALLSPADGRRALVTAQLPDPFNAGAEHPDVARLTDRLDAEVGAYLLRELAYSLRGHPERRVLAEIDSTALDGTVGEGGSGKTTRAKAIQHALGPYANAIGEGVLRPSRRQVGATPDMEGVMPPTRIAFAPEIEGIELDRARVKALSGQDQQTWRPLWQPPRQGTPSATVVLQGNGLPVGGFGAEGDPALRERLRVIPVAAVSEGERDPQLRRAFHLETPGSVERRQALAALLVRMAAGMGDGRPPDIPDAVKDATARLLAADLGDEGVWLRDAVVRDPLGKLAADSLWTCASMAENGHVANARTVFGMDRTQFTLKAREIHGLPPTKSVKVPVGTEGQLRVARGWTGVRLSDEAQAVWDGVRYAVERG